MYRTQIVRRFVQIASFFTANNYFHKGIYQGPLKKFCFPGLNCYACPLARFACPIGSFQHFIAIRQFPFYILGFIGFIGVLSGRFICGFLCPFGFFQELLYKLRTFKIKLPRRASYFKYVVLVLTVVLAYFFNQPYFCKICPAGTLEAGIPQLTTSAPLRNIAGSLFSLKYAILILVLTFAILIKRPFCRLLCPLGAMLGLLNRITQLQLKVDTEKCNECGICQTVCPMDISQVTSSLSQVSCRKPQATGFLAINSFDCIKCLKCSSACPQNAISGFMNTNYTNLTNLTNEKIN